MVRRLRVGGRGVIVRWCYLLCPIFSFELGSFRPSCVAVVAMYVRWGVVCFEGGRRQVGMRFGCLVQTELGCRP